MSAFGNSAPLPYWTWIGPLLSAALLAALFVMGTSKTDVIPGVLALLALGVSVFAAVHHAEIIALRVGEPLGSLVLAVAVTIIEVALIVSILLSATPGSEFVARDTVYSAVMIVLNGVVGLGLVLGGRRHFEQSFRSDGVAAALAVLGTLATISLVFPNFVIAVKGPFYSPSQLLFVGAVSLILYCVFVFVQTVRHRDYFTDAEIDDLAEFEHGERPSIRMTLLSGVLLLASLTLVILLSKLLSKPISVVIDSAGLPASFLGVVIAIIVLLPESLAALDAARANRLQSSLNLAIGSAIASIGLTIPTVALLSIWKDIPLPLGLQPHETVLLVLTLFISTLTLGTGRTTVLHGAVHLVIFGVFLFTAAVP
ncbi:MAG: ionic transporter y4hA [Alphaproteobacteria bacterium]